MEYVQSKGLVEAVSADNEDWSYSINANCNVFLNKKKDFSFMANFYYESAHSLASRVVRPSQVLSALLRKSFKYSTLSIGVNNIAYTPYRYSKQDETYQYSRDWNIFGRTFWISYTIDFGNKKVNRVQYRGNADMEGRLNN